MSEDRAEWNDGRDGENIIITTANLNDITITIAGSGTEDANTFYLNKGSLGTGLVIRPSATIGVVSIGQKTYRDPITVSTAGKSWNKHLRDFNSIVIRPTAVGTVIEILVT